MIDIDQLRRMVPMLTEIDKGKTVEVRILDKWNTVNISTGIPTNGFQWRIKVDLPPKPTQEKLDEWDRDLEDEPRLPTDLDEWANCIGLEMYPRGTAHLSCFNHGGKRWILKERAVPVPFKSWVEPLVHRLTTIAIFRTTEEEAYKSLEELVRKYRNRLGDGPQHNQQEE